MTLKDPITGLNDIAKDFLNTFRDFNKGVWIGKKPMAKTGNIGIASLALEHFSMNLLHYCVRIEGKTYELDGA